MAERKKFFEVKIPLLDSSLSVLAYKISDLNNKIIKYDLTRLLKGKNIEGTFIIKANETEATAEIKHIILMSQFIVRMMRSNISYVEDSFICNTKDGKIRIKPFLLTRKKVHRSVRNALRKKAREMTEAMCHENTTQDVFRIVLGGDIQKEMSSKLKKIYPLSMCEIRAIKIEK